ncbi:ANKRD17 [Symbiodinium pilosum]|uniref:ANKRD17 protein n=1 Tax=Symbiodinium pilosum TaxID=2952 RepID=A0A812NWU3_SYMPI|nr:ANKRD17 [Symbiodinium pilosum]
MTQDPSNSILCDPAGSVDAEDDIFCLAVSFLFVQSLRFTFSGSLPGKLGLYHEVSTEANQMLALYGSAVLMVLATGHI